MRDSISGTSFLTYGLVTLAAVATITVGLVAAWRNQTSTAGIVLGVGFLMLVLMLLAKFKRFKGFGFEAELWEEKQEEAAKLVERLKQLALVTCGPLVRVVSNIGHWESAVPRSMKLQFALDMEKLLVSNGFGKDEIALILEPYRSRVRTDLCLIAMRAADPIMRLAVDAAVNAVQSYPQPIQASDQTYATLCHKQAGLLALQSVLRAEASSPEYPLRVRQAIEASGVDESLRTQLADTLQEPLADIEFYIEHTQLRRPDVWLEDPG